MVRGICSGWKVSSDWGVNKFRRKDIKEQNRGAGFHAGIMDAKLTEEHRWEKNNVCPKCRMVLTRNKKCPMGCDE